MQATLRARGVASVHANGKSREWFVSERRMVGAVTSAGKFFDNLVVKVVGIFRWSRAIRWAGPGSRLRRPSSAWGIDGLHQRVQRARANERLLGAGRWLVLGSVNRLRS